MIKIALFDIKSNRQMYDGTIFLSIQHLYLSFMPRKKFYEAGAVISLHDYKNHIKSR